MAENECSCRLPAILSCLDTETGDGVPRTGVPRDLLELLAFSRS